MLNVTGQFVFGNIDVNIFEVMLARTFNFNKIIRHIFSPWQNIVQKNKNATKKSYSKKSLYIFRYLHYTSPLQTGVLSAVSQKHLEINIHLQVEYPQYIEYGRLYVDSSDLKYPLTATFSLLFEKMITNKTTQSIPAVLTRRFVR